MEWLRSVDLAEYAPNLRGSGVHGGLMVRVSGVQSSRQKYRLSPNAPTPNTSPLSSGSGAAVQRGDHGIAAEHSPKQDSVASPPRHTFQPAHWLRGPAAQTGVSWKPRLHSAYCHHQGQGKLWVIDGASVHLNTPARCLDEAGKRMDFEKTV